MLDADRGRERPTGPVKAAEVQEQCCTNSPRLARHVAVQAAVTPEHVEIADFHIDSLDDVVLGKFAQDPLWPTALSMMLTIASRRNGRLLKQPTNLPDTQWPASGR